jgi:RHS repeat-associated protein
VYDALGRRQRKTTTGIMTDFVYNGLNPVREASGATIIDLLTGLEIDEYLMRTTTGTTEQFLTDALGSTVALTDVSGAVDTEHSYEPFGTPTAISGASSNLLAYTGRESDGTGLYYYRARYYHPLLQRFISEDPIDFLGGDVNLYAYVGNNPVLSVDPLGLKVDWGSWTVSNEELRRRLELFSDQIGRDIVVTGGDRDAKRNREVGGDPTSPHLTGDAVDFHVAGMSDCGAAQLAAESSLFHGIGYYPGRSPLGPHAHVDLREDGRSRRWRHARNEKGDWIYLGWYSRTRIFPPAAAGRKC